MEEIIKSIIFFFPIGKFPNEEGVFNKIRELQQWARNPSGYFTLDPVMRFDADGARVILRRLKNGVEEEISLAVVNFFRNSEFIKPYIQKGARIETGPKGEQ